METGHTESCRRLSLCSTEDGEEHTRCGLFKSVCNVSLPFSPRGSRETVQIIDQGREQQTEESSIRTEGANRERRLKYKHELRWKDLEERQNDLPLPIFDTK